MRNWIVALIGSLALAGCSKSESEPETAQGAGEERATTGGESQTAMSENCPMDVPGTTVQAEDVEGGAALVFMTTGDVDMLRERVRNMAEAEESHAMGAARMGGQTMPGGTSDTTAGAKSGEEMDSAEARGTGTAPMLDVDTRVEDVEDGARLIIIATNPADLDAVRDDAEQRAQQLTSGECPMSGAHGDSTMPEEHRHQHEGGSMD
jgi:hypothetical protein